LKTKNYILTKPIMLQNRKRYRKENQQIVTNLHLSIETIDVKFYSRCYKYF